MALKIYSHENFDFWTTIHSRWGDMDGLRHINHAAYLVYMETARLELYTKLGHDMARWDDNESSILASMQVDYIGQTTHPTIFEIGQRISRIGTKSYDILTAIFKKDEQEPILQAKFVLVSINYKSGKTVPVPQIFKDHYKPIQ